MASQEFQDLISIDLKDNPNILNSYDSVSYNFKLYMMNELTLKKNKYSIKDTPQRIIAQTGKSSIYINDVQIEHWVAPNHKTLSASGTKFTMTLVEPHGMSLLDQIFNASKSLVIANYSRSPMYLELSFKGRNAETGMEKPIPNQNANQLWRLQLINMETQVDAGGTTYILMGHLFNDLAVSESLGRLFQEVEVKGDKFVDMLYNLETTWNAVLQEHYETNTTPLTQYKFYLYENASSAGNSNIFKWEELTFAPSNKYDKTQSGVSTTEEGLIQGNFNRKDAIQEIIDKMISNTKWGNDMNDNLKKTAKDNEVHKKTLPTSYRMETRIEYTGFDSLSNDYNKIVSYHLWPYDVVTPILESMHNKKDKVTNRKETENLVQLLEEKRMVNKQYNYIFTGQNVDIINFDMRFNSMWQAYIPVYDGLYGSDQSDTSALKSVRDVHTKLRINEERRSSYTGATASLFDIKKSTLLDEHRVALKAFRTEDNERQNISRGNIKPTIEFAEDLDITTFPSPVIPISVYQNRDINQDYIDRGMETKFQTGKNLMAAFLNQIYNTRISEFIQIELELRGDPYWLGDNQFKRQTNLGLSKRASEIDDNKKPPLIVVETSDEITKYLSNADTGYPKFMIAEQLFLLTLKTPDLYRDNVTKNSAVINGLYMVYKVVNEFKEGRFTQKLTAKKEPYTSQYSLIALDKAQTERKKSSVQNFDNHINQTEGTSNNPDNTAIRVPPHDFDNVTFDGQPPQAYDFGGVVFETDEERKSRKIQESLKGRGI